MVNSFFNLYPRLKCILAGPNPSSSYLLLSSRTRFSRLNFYVTITSISPIGFFWVQYAIPIYDLYNCIFSLLRLAHTFFTKTC